MLLMMNEELNPLGYFVNAVHLSGLRVNVLTTRAALALPKVGVHTPRTTQLAKIHNQPTNTSI
jgi:hypothetical protein